MLTGGFGGSDSGTRNPRPTAAGFLDRDATRGGCVAFLRALGPTVPVRCFLCHSCGPASEPLSDKDKAERFRPRVSRGRGPMGVGAIQGSSAVPDAGEGGKGIVLGTCSGWLVRGQASCPCSASDSVASLRSRNLPVCVQSLDSTRLLFLLNLGNLFRSVGSGSGTGDKHPKGNA